MGIAFIPQSLFSNTSLYFATILLTVYTLPFISQSPRTGLMPLPFFSAFAISTPLFICKHTQSVYEKQKKEAPGHFPGASLKM
jgi:hypothetical protein